MVAKTSSDASGFVMIGELESMRVGATGHVINKDIYIVDGNPLTEQLTIELWHHEGQFFYETIESSLLSLFSLNSSFIEPVICD